ncbi:hypothetical protein Agub_g13939 [Astrephomene gubernaculifera]|uniref:N-acetyltransferase domain-containing protein n=1 Tax=Astrephomene gubernaculifera TaxID=47775 RepID=A0AAD3E123_9CHLO|nr:hypothetical protein Agub_g13939 [Astrephomene gubernaculifera]
MLQAMGNNYSNLSGNCGVCKGHSQQTAVQRQSPRSASYLLNTTRSRCSCATTPHKYSNSRWDSGSCVTGAATHIAWGPLDDTSLHHAAPLCIPSPRSCASGTTPRSSLSGMLFHGLSPSRCLPGAAPMNRCSSASSNRSSSTSSTSSSIRRRGSRVLPLPSPLPSTAAVRTAAVHTTGMPTPASPTAVPDEVPYTLSGGLEVTVRNVRSLDELRQVSTLRADAYYAESQSRFVNSLKKKFVEQEVESLQQRTTILSRHGQPYSECLVAVERCSAAVLGCIDVRLPAALNGTHPHGVPQDDPAGCYLLNLVVREEARGRGLGGALMRAAMSRAVGRWGAARLYTHVEADNEVAYRLYCSCGFQQHSLEASCPGAAAAGAQQLGCRLLLVAPGGAGAGEGAGAGA